MNHIASTLSANRNGLGLGIVTMSSAKIVALVNQARPTTRVKVRHVHPRFPRDVQHGVPTVGRSVGVTCAVATLTGRSSAYSTPLGVPKRLAASLGRAALRVGSCFVSGRALGSWRSAWSRLSLFLDPMPMRRTVDADARKPRQAADAATGAQRPGPRFARAWVFGS